MIGRLNGTSSRQQEAFPNISLQLCSEQTFVHLDKNTAKAVACLTIANHSKFDMKMFSKMMVSLCTVLFKHPGLPASSREASSRYRWTLVGVRKGSFIAAMRSVLMFEMIPKTRRKLADPLGKTPSIGSSLSRKKKTSFQWLSFS